MRMAVTFYCPFLIILSSSSFSNLGTTHAINLRYRIWNQSKSKCYLLSGAEGLGLMNSRPEVKRTYSRIIKNIASETGDDDDDLHNTNRFRSTEEKQEDSNINRYDREHEHTDLHDSINLNSSPDCVETVKVVDSIKRVKITDFFKKEHRPSREDEENEYNTSNTNSNSNSSAISTISSSRSCTDKTNSPRTKLVTSQKKKDTRTQMFLDLGQTNFVSKQCEECLMHFNASFSEDVQLHRRFHANYLKGFTFTLLNKNKNKKKDEQSIKEILLPQSHYCKKNLDLIKKFKIYSIESFGSETVSSSASSASASVTFKRMESFMDFLHVQLGAEPLTYEEMRRGKYSAMFMTEASSDKIVGFALFEEIQSGFKSKIGCDSSAIELEDQQQDNTQNSTSTDTDTRIKIGVSRIWVDKMFRNRSIGTILLDLKCSNVRSLIAFSQPTPIGFLFAKSYQKDLFNSLQCLLYTK